MLVLKGVEVAVEVKGGKVKVKADAVKAVVVDTEVKAAQKVFVGNEETTFQCNNLPFHLFPLIIFFW